LKACLVHLEENQAFDWDCSHVKFCVSWFSIRVASVGVSLAVQAWNEHPIPGPRGGIPNTKMRSNYQTAKIDSFAVPEPDNAVQMFEANGGQLTYFSPFGHDPLEQYPELVDERQSTFHSYYPDFAQFFYTIVNNDYSLFREGLLYFIEISKLLETRLG
jgi:hypothetical protein